MPSSGSLFLGKCPSARIPGAVSPVSWTFFTKIWFMRESLQKSLRLWQEWLRRIFLLNFQQELNFCPCLVNVEITAVVKLHYIEYANDVLFLGIELDTFQEENSMKMFCWPCILVQRWVNDQLDAQLRYIIRLLFVIRRSVLNLHTGRSFTESTIPDAVLIQYDLLRTNTELLETCRRL